MSQSKAYGPSIREQIATFRLTVPEAYVKAPGASSGTRRKWIRVTQQTLVWR